MRDFRDAKAMASTLRSEFATKDIRMSHAESLELIAKVFGVADWNVLSAAIRSDGERDRDWRQLLQPFYAKHLSREERRGPWRPLFDEAEALFKTGVEPLGTEARDLAKRWIALSEAFTGGNDELRAKNAAAYLDALADPRIAPKLPLSRDALQFMGPALARAHADRGSSAAS